MISSKSLGENHAMPLPAQMFAATKVLASLAIEQGKVKPCEKVRDAYLLYPQEVELSHEVNEHGELEVYTMHRFAGVLARTGHRRWSMHMLEGRWIRQPIKCTSVGYASVYKFDWDTKRVTRAYRRDHIINHSGQRNNEAQINHNGCDGVLQSLKKFRDASSMAYRSNLRPAIDSHMLDLLLADYTEMA